MTAVGTLRRLERAEVLARALCNPVQPPDPIALFRAASGEPDPWQRDVLRSTSPRVLMNVTRQGGKSSVAAAIACHAALSEPGALALVVSPSLRQSGELFRKVLDTYGAAGRPIPPDSETRLSIELANGSRVVSLPGKEGTIRGYSAVGLLVIDEAARVLDELMAAIRPMLAVSGGRLIALSTPFGRRGWFFEAWEHGGPLWERYRVTAHECPRISASFLDEERQVLGDLSFQSEYLCEFCDVDTQVFRSADVDAALDPTITPLWGAA